MYQKDLATAVGLAIVGVIIAYFVTNMIVGEDTTSTHTVKTVDASNTAEVGEPNPEVFNYKALNPTVEVYVGEGDQ